MRRKIKTHIARTLAILGLIILAFAAFPEMPNAEDAWVSLGGVMLKSDNVEHRFNDSGMSIRGWSAGSYKLSSDSSTLYINGLTFSSSDDGVGGIMSNHSLKIIATGTNTINCPETGIYMYSLDSGSLTLSSGGSSKATIKITSSNDTAIVTPDNCTITNVNLNATGDYSGVSIGEKLNMNSGSMTASSLVLDAFNMRDGQINVQNDIVSYNNAKTSLISGGSVTTQGNASFYGLELQGGTVTTKGNLDFFGSLTQTGGTVQSDGDVIFRVGGYTGKGGSFTSSKGITILNGDMLISGANVSSQNGTVDIYGNLTLSGGSLVATGDTEALYAKKVTMNDGTLTMDGSALLWGLNSLELANDIWLSEPSDGNIGDSSDNYTIRSKEGSAASHAVLRKVSSISVKNKPGNDLYENDCFDPAGLVLNVNYVDGSTSPLTYNDAHKDIFTFNYSPKQELSAGSKSLRISCLGKTTSMGFTVKEIGTPVLSGELTTSGVKLNWTKADGAQSYRVFEGDTESGSSRLIAEIRNANITTTTVYDLNPGETKDYTVYAARVSDTGTQTEKPSNVITLTAPISVANIERVVNNGNGYELSWTRVAGATGYEIWRGDGEAGARSLIGSTSGTSYKDDTADSYSTYNYIVKAMHGSGNNAIYGGDSNAAIGKAMERPHDSDPEPVIVPPVKDDPSGAVFGLLQARAAKVTKTSIRIKWKRVAGARKYVIYGNKCGIHNKYKKMMATTNLTMTFTKVAGNRVKKGTYYKFLVYAIDGKGKIISTSKTVHVATTGGKVGNDKSVRTAAKKKKVTIKKGKSFKLKAKPVPASKKLKVQRHRKIAYETSNSKIATVSSKGVIKAKSKGICYVYAYTQNGIFAKVKVTVK